MQNPREHGAGGGFAMRARDGQHPPPPQDMPAEPGGSGCIGNAPVQHRLHQRIAAAQRIAEQHAVRRRGEMRGVIAGAPADFGFGQQLAYRRIQRVVAAVHLVTCGAGELGYPGHQGAADAGDEQFHPLTDTGPSKSGNSP